MHRHQSLNDAISQLRQIKIQNKSPRLSKPSEKYQTKPTSYEHDKLTNKNNSSQSSCLPAIANNQRSKVTYTSNNDTKSDFSKSAIHLKQSINSFHSSTSSTEPKVIKPASNANSNSISKPTVHIRPPEPPTNTRESNPRFSRSSRNIPLLSIDTDVSDSKKPMQDQEIGKKPTVQFSTTSQNSSNNCSYRVHFEKPAKRKQIDIYYKFGVRLSEDQKRSAFYLKKAADEGHLKAIMRYATMLYDGYQVKKVAPQDNKNDRKRIRRISDAGIKRDKKEAARYYKIAADLGDSDAIRKYCSMLFDGDGITKDRKQAAYYYKIQADKGDVDAICQYASMLCNGDGVSQDYTEAARYLQLGIDKGDPCAMRQFAYLYQTGSGVNFNLSEAIKYLRMAADLGDESAIRQFIHMIDSGCGIYIHKKDAAKYYKMAADKGKPEDVKKYKDFLQKNRIKI